MVTAEEAALTAQANAEVENSLSSVKIIKNTKGYSWEVKIYDDNPEIAANTALDIEERIQKKYGGT